jgi:hypothetical protein
MEAHGRHIASPIERRKDKEKTYTQRHDPLNIAFFNGQTVHGALILGRYIFKKE